MGTEWEKKDFELWQLRKSQRELWNHMQDRKRTFKEEYTREEEAKKRKLKDVEEIKSRNREGEMDDWLDILNMGMEEDILDKWEWWEEEWVARVKKEIAKCSKKDQKLDSEIKMKKSELAKAREAQLRQEEFEELEEKMHETPPKARKLRRQSTEELYAGIQ